ncbi:hypothetical protein OIV83_005873 [Microbotryomycetes sp. JL201]|nr:hypothetical protein OIV83_005873 [Microbotryomycetes sp. JL201]
MDSPMDEKLAVKHVEELHSANAHVQEFDPVIVKRIVRKTDFILVPLVTLLFLLNFIDRAAVGNANVAGLSKDLKLSAEKYQYNIGLGSSFLSTALMIFYIFYIIVEPISNLILKKVGYLWLSFLVVGFGAVTIGSAFMKNYGEFVVVRILLGCTEGGVIPAVAFILSRFYTRRELAFRFGIFLALGPTLSGAFGGLLAAGLLNLGSIGSVKGWRCIFLVEGILTTGVGILSIFLLADSPETARFLSAEEKVIASARVAAEHIGNSRKPATRKTTIQGFANIQVWLCAFGYGFVNIIVQGTSLFLPTVVRTLGNYSTIEVQLRSVPPYIVACVYTLTISWLCSRTRRHGIFIIGSMLLSCVGYIIFLASTNKAVLYFATFLTFSGAVPCGPIFLSWAAANSAPDTSRAIATAIVPGVGTWGSIVATWAYLPKYAPRFVPGNALNTAGALAAAAVAGGILLYVQNENKLREQGRRDHRLEGLSQDEIDDLGNRHPDFRLLI